MYVGTYRRAASSPGTTRRARTATPAECGRGCGEGAAPPPQGPSRPYTQKHTHTPTHIHTYIPTYTHTSIHKYIHAYRQTDIQGKQHDRGSRKPRHKAGKDVQNTQTAKKPRNHDAQQARTSRKPSNQETGNAGKTDSTSGRVSKRHVWSAFGINPLLRASK